MRTPRFVAVASLAVLLSALVGGIVGSSAQATQDQVSQQYRVFTAALAAVDREYVEALPSDRLIYDAVGGMLQTLDQHSSFFDPKQYAQMRERQEGKYYGLGISIQVIDGDITVMSLFEGSPAYRSGIRRGDVIARIKGEDTKNWTSDQAVKQLKGPKGTKVAIAIRRPGYDKLIDMDVERDEDGSKRFDPAEVSVKLSAVGQALPAEAYGADPRLVVVPKPRVEAPQRVS